MAVIVVLKTKGGRRAEPTAKGRMQNVEGAERAFDPTNENVGERCREVNMW